MMDALDHQKWRRFGACLRQARLKKGMTQTCLATSLGYAHPSVISGMEKGRRSISEDEVARIALALGCEVHVLKCEEGPL